MSSSFTACVLNVIVPDYEYYITDPDYENYDELHSLC